MTFIGCLFIIMKKANYLEKPTSELMDIELMCAIFTQNCGTKDIHFVLFVMQPYDRSFGIFGSFTSTQ